MMKKEDGRIDWSRSAEEIHNQVRGLDPWPGAYTTLNGELLKLAETSPEADSGGEPGTLSSQQTSMAYACGLRQRLLAIQRAAAGRPQTSGGGRFSAWLPPANRRMMLE